MFLKTRKIGIASTLINLKMAKILKIHQPKKHMLSSPSKMTFHLCRWFISSDHRCHHCLQNVQKDPRGGGWSNFILRNSQMWNPISSVALCLTISNLQMVHFLKDKKSFQHYNSALHKRWQVQVADEDYSVAVSNSMFRDDRFFEI